MECDFWKYEIEVSAPEKEPAYAEKCPCFPFADGSSGAWIFRWGKSNEKSQCEREKKKQRVFRRAKWNKKNEKETQWKYE